MSQQPFSRPGAVDLSGLQGSATSAGGDPGGGPASSAAYVVQVTEQNFQEVLEGSRTAPVLLSFESAGRSYQASVLPSEIPTLAVEAQVTFGWHRWADDVIGIDRFGASAPGDLVLDKLGINVDNVVTRATALVHDEQN